MTERSATDGIWSVDAIAKIDEGAILRFVHYVPALRRPPGVRITSVAPHVLDHFDHGFAYTVRDFWHGPGNRQRKLFRIAEINAFKRNTAVERELISSGHAAFDAAPVFSMASSPGASPLGGNGVLWARIHVHHVGQGDTIVLELPNGELWLLDARFWFKKRQLEFEDWMKKRFPGRQFTKIIVSHLHYDHIRSIPDMILANPAAEVLVPDSLFHPTAAARCVWRAAAGRLRKLIGFFNLTLGALDIQIIRSLDVANIANAVVASTNPNDHEVAILLKTSNSAALLAGDLPGAYCQEILKASSISMPCQLGKRYYKVSHHGSITGYDQTLFQDYPSTHAVISCGLGNSYGHPHRPIPTNLFVNCQITCRDGQQVYTHSIN
jgi:competence protein ComEC